ncbi:hypothetical protein M2323_000341 [Rhodoblastus acidophilus]|uniref:anti-phage-associated DUF3780 domain-containing protein n=1 Tax=Rhodoblastus acidophilus TaxID=1074 RepID=UPI0022256FEB|nr:anti-phage-associated DUF3780 domain-containing protein [Rhodoblastus acidophilus]MCW2282580.1 hypothetical protein [Rhodoblastus acidophilus]MCW2331441.1 hypothetical protein [Rhodoblastus acidophilus]
MSDKKTTGFGVPNEMDPHHFVVEIPAARTEPVVIIEDYGLKGGANGLPETVVRCRLPRATWTAIAEESKRLLNERLKGKKLSTSRWTSGINRVERLLGRELCVLAWGVEAAPKELIPNALRNWVALRPEERWWLFSMASATTGAAEDVDIGWRKAIKVALTENPTGAETAERRKNKGKPTDSIVNLPLFEDY